MVWVRAAAVWGMVLVAMACNGAVRDALLRDRLGEHRANQVSVATGSAVIVALTMLMWRWIGVGSAGVAWGVGAMWLGMTVAFEFLFMHYVAGVSWEKLLREYDVAHGRLWPVVLVVVLCAPAVAWWVRGRGS